MRFVAGSVGFMRILGFDAESTIPARRSGRLLGACHLIKKSRMGPVFSSLASAIGTLGSWGGFLKRL